MVDSGSLALARCVAWVSVNLFLVIIFDLGDLTEQKSDFLLITQGEEGFDEHLVEYLLFGKISKSFFVEKILKGGEVESDFEGKLEESFDFVKLL